MSSITHSNGLIFDGANTGITISDAALQQPTTVTAITPSTSAAAATAATATKQNLNNVATQHSCDQAASKLKHIEMLHEKRRIFLNETIKETEIETESETDYADGGKKLYNIKYATLPTPTKITEPLTAPPKPPMLSRTRSIGDADNKRLPIVDTDGTIMTGAANVMPMLTQTTAVAAEVIKQSSIDTVDSSEANATQDITGSSMCASNVELRADSATSSSSLALIRPVSTHLDINNKQFISTKHYESLIEELRCPGCARPMKSPILLCKIGHSICQQCTRILMMCPLCKETFTQLRSVTVEALCAKAQFRCGNAAGGCLVRMPIALLDWHEQQCIYKPMKCFMGRVWDDCQWLGREIQWKEHLETTHNDKVFHVPSVELTWQSSIKYRPLTGYYVFQVYDEMFNFYELNDAERMLFTMTCTSPIKEQKYNFAYEITITHSSNEALAITQKYPVHSEYDSDILLDGTCVSITHAELAKFLDEDKVLRYRISVLSIKSPRAKPQKVKLCRSPSKTLPMNFQETQNEYGNLKNVPSDMIITRKMNRRSNEFDNADDEVDYLARHSVWTSDPVVEDYVMQQWGTPKLHFNRKYLKNMTNDGSNAASCMQYVDELTPLRTSKLDPDDKLSLCSNSTSYTKKMSNSLRKSFRALKSDIIEMKPFGRKSPTQTEKHHIMRKH